AFAQATVDRLDGSYPAALGKNLAGYQRLFAFPLERYLWFQTLLLWGLWLLLVTGGLFIAVEMAAKGGALCRDLTELFARRLPRPGALAAAAVLLLWPLLLPLGPVWLLLYWSLLLWGYASLSERAVLVVLWVLLGSAPFLVSEQRRRVAVTLS